MNNFPQNLKHLLKSNRITQDQLGDILGKKRSVIGSYTRGEAEPSIENLLKICTFFGCTLSQLVEDNLVVLPVFTPAGSPQPIAAPDPSALQELEENINQQALTLFNMLARTQDDLLALEQRVNERLAALEKSASAKAVKAKKP